MSDPAECAMKLVGKAIKLSDQTRKGMEHTLSTALGDYRDAPHPATGCSPSSLMASGKKRANNHIKAARNKDWQHRLHQRQQSDFDNLLQDITSPPGGNVIGIIPGTNYGQQWDRPIIVGAHWDTVGNTPGFDDNGSGVAVVMEAASILARASCHKNEHTIIFVAFDLEESGCYGSMEFIRKYVIPEFVEKGVEIQGAYILDTLLNFDDDEGSQLVPENWHNVVPDVAKSIRKNKHKGDFLALISRNSPKELKLAKTFQGYYDRLSPSHYRLEHFNLKQMPDSRLASHEELYNHTFFWRSDNSRFWYYEDETSFHSLGGVLLTDTAFHRGFMHKCYHQGCDSSTNPDLSPQTIHFLAKTTQALALALAELSGGLHQ
eukprot:maker-scaffold1038_size68074-snap-gene-0.19 protein:Tk12423 transcript:maker-scaffold1038_size68074-snap-gene-0.19-mRNA-1 annotation:"hypothetical protein DAPPUDRAFT_306809"